MKEFTQTFPMQHDPLTSEKPMRRHPTLEKPGESYYRCCQCKYPLALANDTLSFSLTHDTSSPLPGCSHIFLSNPLSWMDEQIDTDSPGGKLFCPNCDGGTYHVGEYCWIGVQCQSAGCGEIMAPGLALLRRLDGDVEVGVEIKRVHEAGEEGDYEYLTSDEESEESISVEEDNHAQGELDEEVEMGDNLVGNEYDEFPSDEIPCGRDGPTLLHEPLRRAATPPMDALTHHVTSTRSSVLLLNPHHLPAKRSPLRSTWIPPSAPPSTPSSPTPQLESDSSGVINESSSTWGTFDSSMTEMTDREGNGDDDKKWFQPHPFEDLTETLMSEFYSDI
jgi:hypothetical protein